MTNDDLIKLAREAGFHIVGGADRSDDVYGVVLHLERFARLVAADALERERKELEVELLKLKNKAGSVRDYVQGRWDVIGEFQDVLRARGGKHEQSN